MGRGFLITEGVCGLNWVMNTGLGLFMFDVDFLGLWFRINVVH